MEIEKKKKSLCQKKSLSLQNEPNGAKLSFSDGKGSLYHFSPKFAHFFCTCHNFFPFLL